MTVRVQLLNLRNSARDTLRLLGSDGQIQLGLGLSVQQANLQVSTAAAGNSKSAVLGRDGRQV